MFNPETESRNKKMAKSLPKQYVFVFLLLLCFKLSCSNKFFFIGGRESLENGRGFWLMWP
jgi:hypothetical protein